MMHWENYALRALWWPVNWAMRLPDPWPLRILGNWGRLVNPLRRRLDAIALGRMTLGPVGPYAYHATDDPESVLREGLRRDKSRHNSPMIYLANTPENAAGFGNVVLEVDAFALGFTFRPDQWQLCVFDFDIPPAYIRRYAG